MDIYTLRQSTRKTHRASFLLAVVAAALACAMAVAGYAPQAVCLGLVAALPVVLWATYGGVFPRRCVAHSYVAGFEGACIPTWLNVSQVCQRADGGSTGFFCLASKLPGLPLYIRHGREFHGIVAEDGKVYSTEGVVGRFDLRRAQAVLAGPTYG